MRITFVATHVWPAIGGTETFLHHLATELGRDHDVRILSLSAMNEPNHRLRESLLPPPRFAPFADGPVQVEQLVLSPGRRALLAPLVGQVMPGLSRYAWAPPVRSTYAQLYARVVGPLIAACAGDVDIVHHWGSGLLGAATERAARLHGVPSAITPFVHFGQWADDAASFATYRRYGSVFALLDVEANEYRRRGVENVATAGVCSPGVPAGGGAALRAARGIDRPLVVFLGQRRSYKGYDLLEAVAEAVPDTTFAFVGPGPAVQGGNVIDAGRVGDEERAAWLDAADLLCLPSKAEILPVSILEAWSVRTPFLASDIPPLRELAQSGGGWVAPRTVEGFAAQLRSVLGDAAALEAAGEHGYDLWRDRYTPAAVAHSYSQVYERLLEAARPGQVACAS